MRNAARNGKHSFEFLMKLIVPLFRLISMNMLQNIKGIFTGAINVMLILWDKNGKLVLNS